jgi:hypothetical protein
MSGMCWSSEDGGASFWLQSPLPEKSGKRSDHSLTFDPVVQILRAKKTIKITADNVWQSGRKRDEDKS